MHRRLFGRAMRALASAAVALAPGLLLGAPFAYVAGGGSAANIAVLDLATDTVVSSISTAASPAGVAFLSSTAKAYVAGYNVPTVLVIDTTTHTVAGTVGVGSTPLGVAANPAGTRVYVTNAGSNTVSVIDTSTDSVIATVPVGTQPLGVAVDPAGASVYVANKASNTVSVIDTATNAVVGTIAVAGGPYGVAIDPSGSRVYVSAVGGNDVAVIDVSSGTVVATIPVGTAPIGIAIDPHGSRLYVANESSFTVSVIDTATDTVVATVPVGTYPFGIAVDRTGSRVYVGNQGTGPNSGSVSVIDTATATVVNTLNVGGTPHSFGMFIGPDVPGAPPAPAATAGNAQATVSLTPPALDGGSPITGYTVTSIPAGGVDANAGSTATSHTITGLANGTSYTFTVTATNWVGAGPASAPSNSVTPMTVPAAASSVTASAGNAQATVSFTPPASDGGSPITGYTVTSIPAGGVDANAGSTATNHTITGLVNGTAYTFTVTATNAVGTGPASAPSKSVTPTLNTYSGPTATGPVNATVSFTGGGAGCTFAPQGTGPSQSAFFIPVSGHAKSPPSGSAPANVRFPYGLLDFVLIGCAPGSTVTFTVTYPAPLPADTSYYKYGPTPTDATPHWYTIPATIGGNTATFSIADGGLGDDDLAADGTIVDQGGPGIPVAAPLPVPTLSEWALAALAALFAVTGGAFAARRRRM